MKQQLLIFILALMVFSCGQTKEEKTGALVTFDIAKPIQDAGILIEVITPQGSKKVSKITMGSGNKISFRLKNKYIRQYQATLFDRQTVDFIISPEENNVILKIKGDSDRNKEIVVQGSQESKNMYLVEKMIEKHKSEVRKINQDYASTNTNQKKERKRIAEESRRMVERHQQELMTLFKSMKSSFVPVIYAEHINPDTHFDFLSELSTTANKQFENSVYVEEFTQKVEKLRRLAVGSPAPDIVLENPKGEPVGLSSFKGKYVLIDFWASWCKPCREENPHLIKIYKQYSNKNFEIIGVSLDRKKEDWLKAIKNDNLTWTHISDLKYFKSKAAEVYEIEAIPASYLIDPNGIIIAKNLWGTPLEEKLATIYQ